MSKISSFGNSDKGLKRANNEDSFILHNDPGFYAVADGMGGAVSGEIASKIFTDTAIEVLLSKSKELSPDEIRNIIQTIFYLANSRILDKASKNSDYRGMGCTAELMIFSDQIYMIGHVGDSRTYQFRDGQLKQVTKDHSLVQEQIDKGKINRDEARHHNYRNVILRAVGIDETLAVDLISGNCQTGDIYLLCSDGLTDMIEDSSIINILSQSNNVEIKVRQLIDMALSAGGNDNITVILCQVM